MTNYTNGTTKEYRTRDLNESAYLYCMGKKLLRLEDGDREFWFVFEDKDGDCETLVNSFWAREARVVALDYADALRTLKDRIFARKG